MKCCMLFYLLYDRIFIVRLVGLASFRFRNSEATEKKVSFFSFSFSRSLLTGRLIVHNLVILASFFRYISIAPGSFYLLFFFVKAANIVTTFRWGNISDIELSSLAKTTERLPMNGMICFGYVCDVRLLLCNSEQLGSSTLSNIKHAFSSLV